MSASFDRVRARGGADHDPSPMVDSQGKSALFSRATATPSLGTVAVTCSQCHGSTTVSYLHALRLAIPSLHLLVIRRDYPSWMRCPSCGRRTWVHVRFA